MTDADRLQKRVAVLRQSLERDPEDAMAWYALGRAEADTGDADAAQRAYRRALEVRPDYTAAFRELARSLVESDELDGAIEVLRRGLAVAEETGDLQTGREMQVFLRRAERRLAKGERGSA
ncbi:MAG: tetratricopeptide repeat protein [Proteobacteria bacterium]|nr:tetratricopeptide repeat protein [Pseudomonadota bacterium]